MTTLAEFWPQCLRLLHAELSEQQFNLAIAPLTVGVENGAWVVYAKNQFAANLLRAQYAGKIETVRQKIAAAAPALQIKIGAGERYEMAVNGEAAVSGSLPTPPPAASVPKNVKKTAPKKAADKSSGSLKKPNAVAETVSGSPPSDIPAQTKRPSSRRASKSPADAPPVKKTAARSRKKSGVLGALAAGLLPESPAEERLPQTPSLFPLLPEVAPPPKPSAPKKSPAKTAPSVQATAQDILAKRLQNLHPDSKKTAPPPPPKNEAPSAPPRSGSPAQAAQPAQTAKLSPEYTFATLVEGKGNHLAAAIAKNLADKPGDAMYNPFFVYGSTGLGKTHLVQAIGNQVLACNPQAKVRYIHTNEYLKNFMVTVRNKTWDGFKQQYLNYNLLIIDDIQFIQGKERTMEEFFFLFEHFHSHNRQIILTCDQLPSSLKNMDKRLISRFSWGMSVKLEPPELEMRIGILQHKARAEGVSLHDDAAVFIAQNIKQNVRELEGALKRVLARCRFQGSRLIDVDTAAEALQDIIGQGAGAPIGAELIMKTVADYYKIRVSDLMGKSRARSIARPRQLAMCISKELTNLSFPAIGEAFGGRDHSTVMHAVKTVAKLRGNDEEVGKDYEKLLLLVQN